jgi:aerobic carbon-monoxide dehydrogenase medium subunit
VKRFDYFEPRTLDEAVALLAKPNAQALAGGTDLLVELKEHLRHAERVINIKKIAGLRGLSFDAKDGLRIGALATARDVELSPIVKERYRGLLQSVRELGSIQVRYRATIIGNICRASPSADTIPPLIADGAIVRVHGSGGERSMPLEDFFVAPGKTVLKPGDVVTEIRVAPPAADTRKVYIKHGRRKAMELATVGVAVTHVPGGQTRIVLGAVAPTAIRARQAEKVFSETGDIQRAAQAAADESRPISNVRATAEYRREMVAVLTRRALEQVR